jgi:MoxR-like ATPase
MRKSEKYKSEFIESLVNGFGSKETYTAKEIQATFATRDDWCWPSWLTLPENRVKRGHYALEAVNNVVPMPTPIPKQQVAVANLSVETNAFSENLIPAKDDLFVPFGNFRVVRDIIKSGMFYPIFITGLSGNGKTYMVEQACAATKREVIRVNFTVETDEDDLIGGFRLVDGDTKFFKGPVISAMEKGAVLLCDEIDLANPAKVMCLQSILEGNGYFIKKTGEFITPAPGFTIVATANTKGKGSDDGRFIGTNILNEAFLERYPITCEQEYPTTFVEKKILSKVAESVGVDDSEYVEKLTDWADIIRKTFADGGVDEIISTRRLVHIIKAYAIFNDRMTAIEMCTNRFDEETKLAFRDLYTKLDAEIAKRDMDDEIDSIIEESEVTGNY